MAEWNAAGRRLSLVAARHGSSTPLQFVSAPGQTSVAALLVGADSTADAELV